MPNHLQSAVAYRSLFSPASPERDAVDGLIDLLIETATFDYADHYETQEFLRTYTSATRKDTAHA